MIRISVRNNFPEVAKQMQRMGEQAANRAMAKALNATVEQGKTAMARQISGEFRVSIKHVKERLFIERAHAKGTLRLSVVLEAARPGGLHNNDYRGMNLIHFVVGGIPKRTAKGKRRQLSFQIKRASGRKSIPGAFVGTNRKTGGTAVFVREGNSRLPIKTITTIDVPQMFNTRRINQAVRKIMLDRFAINFKREARAITKGFAR